jgi:hypothetical protein
MLASVNVVEPNKMGHTCKWQHPCSRLRGSW